MFIIQVPYCDIGQIFMTDQTYRWRKLDQESYFITTKDKGVRVKQQKDRLIFDCDEKNFFDVWYPYLDIGEDYMQLNFDIRRAERDLKPWAVRGSGIHIIKQDLFEVIITSMLLQAKSRWGDADIKSILEFLCDTCGVIKRTSIRGCGVVKWHVFPTPEQIVRRRKALLEHGLGGCAQNIIQLCQDILDGWLDLVQLRYMTYDEAMELLQEFSGINRWIAERICAFGLYHSQAYPIDKKSALALKQDFDCKADEFNEWYLRTKKTVRSNRALVALWAKYQANNPPKDWSG